METDVNGNSSFHEIAFYPRYFSSMFISSSHHGFAFEQAVCLRHAFGSSSVLNRSRNWKAGPI